MKGCFSIMQETTRVVSVSNTVTGQFLNTIKNIRETEISMKDSINLVTAFVKAKSEILPVQALEAYEGSPRSI
jgi:hypothetical protein